MENGSVNICWGFRRDKGWWWRDDNRYPNNTIIRNLRVAIRADGDYERRHAGEMQVLYTPLGMRRKLRD